MHVRWCPSKSVWRRRSQLPAPKPRSTLVPTLNESRVHSLHFGFADRRDDRTVAWLQVVTDSFDAVHADRKAFTVAAPTAAGPDRAAAALAHTTEASARVKDLVHSTARLAGVAGSPHVHATAAVAGDASPVPDLVVVADAAGHVHPRTTRTHIKGSSDTTAADAARLVDATVTAADAAASALPKRCDSSGLSSMIPPWCSTTIWLTPVPAHH
jgi:hypothetical protein